ncbi:MAG: hypothetical protein ACEQSC_00985 [Candidatus Nanopelagicaceae bacterium]
MGKIDLREQIQENKGHTAMINATATISPAFNEVKVKIVFDKSEKKAAIFETVNISLGLGVKFACFSVSEKQLILDKCKAVQKSLDTVILDLNTAHSVNAGFVPAPPTGYRTAAMRQEDWQRNKSISKEKSFDNLNNEGGEGFNPYRDA